MRACACVGWMALPCAPRCAANTISQDVLPVISATSEPAVVEAGWLSYLERIYHQRLGKRVLDTKRFTWFYNEMKPAVLDRHPCTAMCRMATSQGPKYDGTPWIGQFGPEGPNQTGAYGFFVHRPFLSVEEAVGCTRLEVMHVAARWLGGPERGGSWFFHTVGSGIFLDCDELRRRGRIIAFKNRFSPGAPPHDGAKTDLLLPKWMEAHGVSMVVYTEADFRKHLNPRTEILVRHMHLGHHEYENDRGACLDHPTINMPLRTGFEGQLSCRCIPQSNLLHFQGDGSRCPVDSTNCHATPMSE